MKIPLTVLNCAGGLKPFLFAFIKQAKFRVFGQIRLFIDTGSPWSTISEQTIKTHNWRFSYKKLGNPMPFCGISGGRIPGYPMKDITLTVKDEKNKSIIIKLSKIYFLIGKISENLPNILGGDFLLENNFKFYYNISEKVAYLES